MAIPWLRRLISESTALLIAAACASWSSLVEDRFDPKHPVPVVRGISQRGLPAQALRHHIFAHHGHQVGHLGRGGDTGHINFLERGDMLKNMRELRTHALKLVWLKAE